MRRTLVYVAEDFENVHLALRLPLVLVDVCQDLKQRYNIYR